MDKKNNYNLRVANKYRRNKSKKNIVRQINHTISKSSIDLELGIITGITNKMLKMFPFIMVCFTVSLILFDSVENEFMEDLLCIVSPVLFMPILYLLITLLLYQFQMLRNLSMKKREMNHE